MGKYGMNEQAAKEWLEKSWHNLSTAKLLYDANHYTDVIAMELHYSSEKALKSILAYHNKKILKTHDLFEIYKEIKSFIDLESYVSLLDQISEYHIEESYPTFYRKLPPREEMKDILDFGYLLFEKVCKLLNIDKEKLI